MSRTPWRCMGLSFLLALVVRVLYLMAFNHTIYGRVLLIDADWHDQWAWTWAQGAYRQSEAFFRAPLYPFWLSRIYQVFGHSPEAVRWVQAVLGATSAAALAGTAHRLAGSRAGWAAGLMTALYGPLLFFETELLIPSLLVFLMSWALFFLVRGEHARNRWLAAGLLGLAAAARPNVLVLILPVGIWILGLLRERPARARWGAAAVGAAIMLAPALYITGINYKVEGRPVFVASQGGLNLYIGNNPQADGRAVFIPEVGAPDNWLELLKASHRYAESQAGHSLTGSQASDYWAGRVFSWAKDDPGAWLALTGKKVYYLLNAMEIPNNRDLYMSQLPLLRPLVWKVPFFAFPWGLIFPLAVVGLMAAWRNRPAAGKMLALWLALYGLSLVVFFVCARFRMGLVPAMVVAAALPFGFGVSRIPKGAWIAGAFALLLCNTAWWNVREQNPAQETANLATLQLGAGEREAGMKTLEEAVALAPNRLLLVQRLAGLYVEDGAYAKAAPLYRRAVDLAPRDGDLRFMLGAVYLQLGRNREAVQELSQAALLNKDASTWVNLGTALQRTGEEERAEEAFSRAESAVRDILSRDPGNAEAKGILEWLQNRN